MNKGQQHEDTVLEEARYLLTGVLRPLDILGYEICSANIADTDAQQFLQMIHDVRSLLLNISYTLNYQTKFLTVNAFFDDPAVSLQLLRALFGSLRLLTFNNRAFHDQGRRLVTRFLMESSICGADLLANDERRFPERSLLQSTLDPEIDDVLDTLLDLFGQTLGNNNGISTISGATSLGSAGNVNSNAVNYHIKNVMDRFKLLTQTTRPLTCSSFEAMYYLNWVEPDPTTPPRLQIQVASPKPRVFVATINE
ncbi:hypothetical protein A0J61_03257 [Choanephora cucurbitarum]|uniref:Uncharacterized protein n=1 Tax=Choanephora cucurbitarum TaxID=101091 RepID=A0A1C7NHS9_9FUNG|nr:hypothetical protein A0J61_03257 [Choanephora cucurbitarum]